MPEKCTESCPLVPRVEALEEANRQHGSTHREMYDRLRALEKENAVQNAHYKAIDDKLDDLTSMVKELTEKLNEVERKPAKRWDKVVETLLVAIVTGVVCFLLGRVGL